MDSSRVSTFLIPMLLIVYGSFRYVYFVFTFASLKVFFFIIFSSLNMEQEAKLKEKENTPKDGCVNDNSKLLTEF